MLNKLVLLILLFCIVTSGFSQSPWVNREGSIYGQLSSSYLSYSNLVNDEGNLVEASYSSTDLTIGLFGEYSMTNRTSVIVDLPYKAVQSNGERLSSLGDASFKVKHQLKSKIPVGIYYGYTAPFSEREGFLRTGHRQHALDLGLSTGIGRKKFYVYGSLGYKYRTNIPDQVIIDAEYGYMTSLAKRQLFLMVHLYGTINTSQGIDLEAAEANLYHNAVEFISPGVKLSYNPIGHFWINFGLHSGIWVRNTGAVPSLSVGLAYSLKK